MLLVNQTEREQELQTRRTFTQPKAHIDLKPEWQSELGHSLRKVLSDSAP